MATPLIPWDLLFLFKPVFIFLFVFTLFYAVLNKVGILGNNKGVQFLISFSTAMLFMFTADTMEFVDLVVPWLAVLLIIIMGFMVLFMFMGVSGETIAGVISQREIIWPLVALLLVLLVIALVKVFGVQVASLTQTQYADGTIDGNQEGQFFSNVGEIIFSTKLLGMFLLLVIAAFAINALKST